MSLRANTPRIASDLHGSRMDDAPTGDEAVVFRHPPRARYRADGFDG
jgi:hypothetical protein